MTANEDYGVFENVESLDDFVRCISESRRSLTFAAGSQDASSAKVEAVQPPQQPEAQSGQVLLSAAARLKSEGNRHFQRRELTAARCKYDEALDRLQESGLESPELEAALRSNRAVCHIHCEAWEQAEEDAQRACDLYPMNDKFKERLAQVRNELGRSASREQTAVSSNKAARSQGRPRLLVNGTAAEVSGNRDTEELSNGSAAVVSKPGGDVEGDVSRSLKSLIVSRLLPPSTPLGESPRRLSKASSASAEGKAPSPRPPGDIPDIGNSSWKAAKLIEEANKLVSAGSTRDALHIGCRVRWINHNDRPSGTVLFVGTTDFSIGDWVGVCLDDALGKNDGTIKGRQYFECAAGHGILVRPKALEVMVAIRRPSAVPEAHDGGDDAALTATGYAIPPTGERTADNAYAYTASSQSTHKRRPSGRPEDAEGKISVQLHLILQEQLQRLREELAQQIRSAEENIAQELSTQVQIGLQAATAEISELRGEMTKRIEEGLSALREDCERTRVDVVTSSEKLTQQISEVRTNVSTGHTELAAKAEKQTTAKINKLTAAMNKLTMARILAGGRKLAEIPKLGDVEWQQAVPPPATWLRRNCEVNDTHQRAITGRQLTELSEHTQTLLETIEVMDPNTKMEENVGQITWQNVNLYHLNDLVVKPLTKAYPCSWVELIAGGPQRPVWFISHWWGTRFQDTFKMLGFHLRHHGLDDSTPYWMCTFANNQHDLGELEEPNLFQTPFVMAIMSETCRGTLMLMDDNATPFQRAWCTLENFVTTTYGRGSMKQSPQLLEIAAVIPEGSQYYGDEESGLQRIPESAALLCQQTDGKMVEDVEEKGAWFPCIVAERAIDVDIVQAKVTNKNDKRNILRLIAGISDANLEPPAADSKYEEVNRSIHKVFAPRVLISAAMDGNVKCVKQVLDRKLCGPDVWDKEGNTPAYVAASQNQLGALEVLIQAKADLNISAEDKSTPLSVAVQQCHTDALRLLLAAGADTNLADERGTTPVLWAVAENNAEALWLLLEAKADVNHAANDGSAAIHIAAEGNQAFSLRLLVEARADVRQKTPDGQTAWSIARAEGSSDVQELLAKAASLSDDSDSDCLSSTSGSRRVSKVSLTSGGGGGNRHASILLGRASVHKRMSGVTVDALTRGPHGSLFRGLLQARMGSY
eukprot:TRINITY_DN24348_c0_g1_i1.p1 TRINITY_DN24348_c0_g1~~TRINITY_DN24348_c0_g1_i1.p1  ORF type:complete len:1160 (-),score=239.75 TRINITY_DN24348_c0_g1_i1:122-3601(-)